MTELNLVLEHLRKSYLRPVLTDVNLQVTNDSYVTIMGKSGSGKSTLLNILGLVEGYDGGSYWFNGVKIRNFTDFCVCCFVCPFKCHSVSRKFGGHA